MQALTTSAQMFGVSDEDSLDWQFGIFCKHFSAKHADTDASWIVCFANRAHLWLNCIQSVFHPYRPFISVPNGETLPFPEQNRLIFVLMNSDIIDLPIYRMPNVNNSVIKNYKNYIDEYDENLRRLLEQMCIPIFHSTSLPKFLHVSFTIDDMFDFFLKLLRANMKIVSNKQYDPNIVWINKKGLTYFSLVASLCLYMTNVATANEAFLQQSIIAGKERIIENIPAQRLVTDCYYICDAAGGRWLPYTETVDEQFYLSIPKELPLREIFVQSQATERFIQLINIFILTKSHVLLIGSNGSGKSSIVKYMLKARMKSLSIDLLHLICCPTVPVENYQAQINEKILRRKQGVYGPTEGKLLLIFVENFTPDSCLSSIILQLIRHSTFYRYLDEFQLIDFVIILTCSLDALPWARKFGLFGNSVVIPMQELDEPTITYTMEQSVLWHFQSRAFSNEYLQLSNPIAVASVKILSKIKEKFQNSNSFVHFTSHDLWRLVKGVSFSTPDTAPDILTMIRLWVHETFRVFGDRPIDDKHFESWLLDQLKPLIQECFRLTVYDLFKHLDMDQDGTVDENEIQSLIFCDFAEAKIETIPYAEIRDRLKFETTVANFIIEHNTKRRPHLNLPSSSSCIRLAAYIADYVYVEFDLSSHIQRNDSSLEWRSTIRYIIETVIDSNRHVACVIILPEVKLPCEITDEIATCLLTGNFWNRFSASEQTDLYERMQQPEKYLATLAQQTDIRLPGQREITKLPDNVLLKELQYRFTRRLKEQIHWILIVQHSDFLNKLRTVYPEVCSLFSTDVFPDLDDEEATKLATSMLRGLDEVDVDKLVEFFSKIFFDLKTTQHAIRPTHFITFLQTWRRHYEKSRKRLEQRQRQFTQAKLVLHDLYVFAEKPKLDWSEAQTILRDIMHETSDISEELKQQSEKLDFTRKNLINTESKLSNLSTKLTALSDELRIGMRQVTTEVERCQSDLKAIDKAELKKLAAMKKPLLTVRLTVEAAVLLLDKNFVLSKNKLETWEKIQLLIVDKSFMKLLQNSDYKNISKEIVLKVNDKYVHGPEPLIPVKIEQQLPLAGIFIKWVASVCHHCIQNEQFWPHKRELEKRESEVIELERLESEQKEQLTQLLTEQNSLTEKRSSLEKHKQLIENNFDCYNRSTTILEALSKIPNFLKFEEILENADGQTLLGDTLLTSSVLSFSGLFNESGRKTFISNVKRSLKKLKFTFDKDWSLEKVLHHFEEKTEPNFFTDSLNIITTNSEKWPFLYDPDGLSLIWLNVVHAKDHLKVTSLKEAKFWNILVNALRQGSPLLVRDFDFLPSDLIPLIRREIRIEGDLRSVEIKGTPVDYSPNFRLYLSSNRHFLMNGSFMKEFLYLNFEVCEENLYLLFNTYFEWTLLNRVSHTERLDVVKKIHKCQDSIFVEFSTGIALDILQNKQRSENLVIQLQLLENLNKELENVRKPSNRSFDDKLIKLLSKVCLTILQLKINRQNYWFTLKWIMLKLDLFNLHDYDAFKSAIIIEGMKKLLIEISSGLLFIDKIKFLERFLIAYGLFDGFLREVTNAHGICKLKTIENRENKDKNLWEKLTSPKHDSTPNYIHCVETLLGKYLIAPDVHSWKPPSISGHLILMLTVNIDTTFAINYLTLKSHYNKRPIKFITMATFDLDEFKKLLRQTNEQLFVFLDLPVMKQEVMEFIEIQMEGEDHSDLTHFHANLSFILLVDDLSSIPCRVLDFAEKTFLIRPRSLKDWFYLILNIVCWPTGLTTDQVKSLFVISFVYVIILQYSQAKSCWNMLWFNDLIYKTNFKLQSSEPGTNAIQMAIELMFCNLTEEDNWLKLECTTIHDKILSESKSTVYVDNAEFYKISFKSKIDDSIAVSIKDWPAEDTLFAKS